MAITVYGVDPSIDELWWSRLHRYEMGAGCEAAVFSGLAVTPGTGRTVNVALGRWFAAGVVGDSTTDVTNLAVGANATSFTRMDLVCAKIDWAQPAATAGSIVVVQGATPTVNQTDPPSVANSAGSTWWVPLATVQVLAGATSFAAARIVDRRFFGYDRCLSGTVSLTNGQTVTVPLYPAYSSPPTVTVSAYTGAGATTISNPNVSNVGTDSFDVTLNRSTATATTLAWQTSGR